MSSIFNFSDHGCYLGPLPQKRLSKSILSEDGEVHQLHNVIVHRFQLQDDLQRLATATDEIQEWMSSECGQWVKEHSMESPKLHKQYNIETMQVDCAITAILKERDHMIWILKYT